MEFLNSQINPFDEVEDYEIEIVHIWLKQRNGKKYTTEVTGLAKDLNTQKIIKYWKYIFHVSVARVSNDKNEKVIKLQGDQRDGISKFLIEEKIIDKKYIKIHGF